MDLHVHNASILVEPGKPRARSMLIRGGRVDALDVEAPSSVESFDAGGRVVAPGLIDAHLHLLMGGIQLRQLDLSGVRSRGAFEALVEKRHRALPPGEWLIANGWNEAMWDAAEGLPDQTWLRAAEDRPVLCYRSDIHAAVVNEAVLRRCPSLHDPPGGRFVRDASGQCTGLVLEAALWKVIHPVRPEPSVAEQCEALRTAVRHCHSLGVTTVGSMEYSRDVEAVFRPSADELSLRIQLTFLDERAWPMSFDHFTSFEPFARVRAIGCKAFLDGTLGSRTAHLLEEYADDPGNRGLPVELGASDGLREWARAVVECGGSPSVHAIGDAAARQALDAFEGLSRSGPGAPRLEHAQQMDAADIARTDGLFVSMQPLHRTEDARIAKQRLGEARLNGSFAFRELAEAGAILAFGSDWPVVSCDPMAGIRAAVTGLDDQQRAFQPASNLDVHEAIRAYTVDAAAALQREDLGRLVPGSLADFVVIDEDLVERDWTTTRLPRVERTYVEGVCVYERG